MELYASSERNSELIFAQALPLLLLVVQEIVSDPVHIMQIHNGRIHQIVNVG